MDSIDYSSDCTLCAVWAIIYAVHVRPPFSNFRQTLTSLTNAFDICILSFQHSVRPFLWHVSMSVCAGVSVDLSTSILNFRTLRKTILALYKKNGNAVISIFFISPFYLPISTIIWNLICDLQMIPFWTGLKFLSSSESLKCLLTMMSELLFKIQNFIILRKSSQIMKWTA